MDEAKKTFWLQSLKTGVFAFIFACVSVLVLALFAKLCNISDKALPVINLVLKALSVVAATLLFVKDEKFLFKSIVGAVIFWVLATATFSVIGGSFHFAQVALDLGIALVSAVPAALLKSKRA